MRLKTILAFVLILFTSFGLFSQSWCKKADFPGNIRRNTEGFSINGKGYVCLGGISPTSPTHFMDLEMYDPAADTWTSKTDFPGTARRNGIAFTIDSFAFVGMGWNNSNNFSDIYRYNANTDTWDTITPYPGLGNRNPIATSLNGKGYMGGGTNSTSNPHQEDFYEYDPVLDKWTQLADLTFGSRSSAISFAGDSLIYFGLGYNGNNVYNDLWSYKPSTSTWTQLSSFPGNSRLEASYFQIDNNTVIVGGGTGFNSSLHYSDYYEYDIKNDKWTTIIGFTGGARSRGAYFAIDNKGYISTGRSASANLKDTWEYSPTNNNFSFTDSLICNEDSILLDESIPNATYLWQDSSTNSTFTAKDSGIYWVVVSLNTCTKRDSIKLAIKPEIPLNLGSDTTICSTDSIFIDVSVSGATYLWQDSSTNASFTAKDSGTYWVEITLDNCTKRDLIEVTYADKVDLNIGNDTTLCLAETITLDAFIPSSSYLWRDSSTNSSFIVFDTGLYWVSVQTKCTNLKDSIQVAYKDCNCTLKIPNVITPNKDGINDYFFLTSSCIFTSFTLSIFNRWGVELIQLNSQFHRWDGTVNGINADEGVYFYTIVYTLESESKEQSKSGNFTILR